MPPGLITRIYCVCGFDDENFLCLRAGSREFIVPVGLIMRIYCVCPRACSLESVALAGLFARVLCACGLDYESLIMCFYCACELDYENHLVPAA